MKCMSFSLVIDDQIDVSKTDNDALFESAHEASMPRLDDDCSSTRADRHFQEVATLSPISREPL